MMLRVSMILLATIVSTMALPPPLYQPEGKMDDIYPKLFVFVYNPFKVLRIKVCPIVTSFCLYRMHR